MSIPAVRVSDLALKAVFSRISSPTAGFNPLFAQQAELYGISPSFALFDFSSRSHNFVFGQISPDQLEESGFITYPFSCMYVLDSVQTNSQKFTTFSGAIRVIYDVYLSWTKITGLFDFEVYVNCVESVVVSIANEVQNQDWGKPLVYNGNVQCRRGPLGFDGTNWRQKMGFSFLLEVHE